MDKIHIIFTCPPGPASEFVEVENDAGHGMRLGDWEQRGDMWELVFDPLTLVMQCEAHQGVVWPHDDCLGPGMPLRTSL